MSDPDYEKIMTEAATALSEVAKKKAMVDAGIIDPKTGDATDKYKDVFVPNKQPAAPKISDLRKKLSRLRKKEHEVQKKIYDLEDEITYLQNDRFQSRITKHIHVGDIKIINEGITHYHCDPITVYEILEVSSYTNRYKHNGEWVRGKEFHTIKARKYYIHCYDFDMNGGVEIEKDVNAETLLKAKNMSKQDFEEFKTTLFLNPDMYEGSKWDPKRKE